MRAAPLMPVLCVLVCLISAPVEAQTPVGSEFQVNTHTYRSQQDPALGPDGAGGFVVVWSGVDAYTSSGVKGQRFAADGTPAGVEFQVNTFTTDEQDEPSVGLDGAGGFVVAWSSDGSSGTDLDVSIQAQRYASNGTPVGGEFQANTYTTDTQGYPAVGPDGGGGFVVAWSSRGSNGTDSSFFSVQAQRYASDGTPVGGEFQVNTFTTNYQGRPAVGPDGGGGFVVVWMSEGSYGTDTDRFSVQAQRYASDGTPAGGEFQVNTSTTHYQFMPSVGSDGAGGFVIAWSSYGSNGTNMSVQAQRYVSDGAPLGGEFQVNTYTTGYQSRSTVAAAAGGFAIAWSSDGSNGTDASSSSIQAQHYASDGTPIGKEFQVNTYTTNTQANPAVGPGGAGEFVVVWESRGSSGDDSDDSSIQGQRYRSFIFEDGFESGDLSAWSQSVP